jgi:hypothetical protein
LQKALVKPSTSDLTTRPVLMAGIEFIVLVELITQWRTGLMSYLQFFRVMLALTITLWTTPSSAWDGIKSGKISGIDVTDGQNFGFRVYMDGTPMCGTDQAWGYINKDWDNYDAMVSVLTSAYFNGKTVMLHMVKTGPYCQIHYAVLR